MLVPGGRVGGLDSRVSPGPKTYCSVDRSPRTSRMSWLQLWLASGPLDMCFSFGHGQQMILPLPCKPALQMGVVSASCWFGVSSAETARTISESGAVGDPICKIEWNSQPSCLQKMDLAKVSDFSREQIELFAVSNLMSVHLVSCSAPA